MERIFNNMLLFENKKLFFSVLFSEIFLEGDKAFMEGNKVVMGDPLSSPTRENPVQLNWIL